MPLVHNKGRPIPKGGLKDKRKTDMSFSSPNRIDLPSSGGVGGVGSGSGIVNGGDLGKSTRRSGSSDSGRSGKN